MTSSSIQTAKLKVENFEQVGNELATMRHLTAGNEAEVRRAHTEIAMLKLSLAGAAPTVAPVAVDLAPVISRLQALESRPVNDTETAQLFQALSAEISTLNSKLLSDAKRIADLERTVGEIGGVLNMLAAKAA